MPFNLNIHGTVDLNFVTRLTKRGAVGGRNIERAPLSLGFRSPLACMCDGAPSTVYDPVFRMSAVNMIL